MGSQIVAGAQELDAVNVTIIQKHGIGRCVRLPRKPTGDFILGSRVQLSSDERFSPDTQPRSCPRWP